MWFDIFVQALGFLGIAIAIIAVQFNTHKNIVLFKTLAEIPFLIQYIFLNAYVGMVMGVIGIIRNIILRYKIRHNQKTLPVIILASIITVTAGIATITLTFDSTVEEMCKFSSNFSVAVFLAILFSAMSIMAKMLTTVAYGIKEPKIIRALNFPSSLLWFIYNLVFFSLAGVLNEIFVMSSIIIASIRYRNVPPLKQQENISVTEIEDN